MMAYRDQIPGTPGVGEKQCMEKESESLCQQGPATFLKVTTGGAHKPSGPKSQC